MPAAGYIGLVDRCSPFLDAALAGGSELERLGQLQ